ncbi:MAG TPA: DUF4349 domain-containing protein [Anaerolineales bacterium]|nr:DUF4349 domain-containing protein [Anaerolineales bacterium]
MKRPLFIILTVIALFLVISFTFTRMVRQRGDNALFSPSFGFGGGAATELPAAEPPAMPATDFFAPEEAARQSVDNSVTSQQGAQDRLVIKNADLAVVVKDPEARMKEISAMANEMGGFVVSSNLYQSYYGPNSVEVPEATIVIRVPSERLDEALERIKEGAVDVDYENISGQDVTSQYVDLQSQLRAKEAAEQKLLEILDQATRAEDVLAIYLQVQQVQTEIEMLKGQIKYLEESADLSSISVRLIAEESAQPITVGPWTPGGAVKEAIEDLILFVQNFVDFLIYFVLSILPSLILIAIPVYLVYLAGRAVYRRVNKSNVKVEEEKK